MIKLPKPTMQGKDIFTICSLSIRGKKDRSSIIKLTSLVIQEETLYDQRAPINDLHLTSNSNVLGLTTKEDLLKKNYTGRMVPKSSQGRLHYDKLLLIPPNGICPFCGHRQATTIDHYLPKSEFAHLSVLPFNLVASCRDCNSDKSDINCKLQNELFFHPYYEDITNEEWLFCTISSLKPLNFKFTVTKPSSWTNLKFTRLENQFDSLNLDKFYSIQSDEEINNIYLSLCSLYDSGSSEDVRLWLLDNYRSKISHRKNSWQTALYRELYSNQSFYKNGFR